MPSNQSQPLHFNGRVAIVTGAGQGMGREHALLLGSRGATVIVNDLFPDVAESTAKDIRDAGGKAVAVAGSIAERTVAEAILQTAIDKYGRIDILINNAGIEIKKGFPDFTDADLSRMWGVHVLGAWVLTQLVWPHMKTQKYGRVVMVSSTSLFGMPDNAAYVASKGALFGLARSLSIEGAAHGILVNCLGPTAYTAMAKQMLDDETRSAWMEKIFPASATSAVCAWLVHENCQLTGEFITSYGRSVGRVFLAETKGAFCPTGDYTLETVRDHMDEARDTEGFIVPKSVDEQIETLLSTRQAKAAGQGE